jgi:hypothetical protein
MGFMKKLRSGRWQITPTTMVALIVFSAIIAPMAQGQEVRRALPVTAGDRYEQYLKTGIAKSRAERNELYGAYVNFLACSTPHCLEMQRLISQILGSIDSYLNDATASLNNYYETKAQTAQIIASRDDPTPNDCLIVATEAFNRLQKTAHWVKIAGLRIIVAGKIVRHAVVFFQPTPDSKIWMYDASGSIDLDTQSQDLEQITPALKSLVTNLESVEFQ